MCNIISITLVILMRLLPISLTALGSLDTVRKLGWCSVDRGMKLTGNLGTQGERVGMDMD